MTNIENLYMFHEINNDRLIPIYLKAPYVCHCWRIIMDNVIAILEEILEAKRRGISVSINGVVPAWNQPEELLMTLEEATYMKDYIGDDRGKIVQIRFDRIQTT